MPIPFHYHFGGDGLETLEGGVGAAGGFIGPGGEGLRGVEDGGGGVVDYVVEVVVAVAAEGVCSVLVRG